MNFPIGFIMQRAALASAFSVKRTEKADSPPDTCKPIPPFKTEQLNYNLPQFRPSSIRRNSENIHQPAATGSFEKVDSFINNDPSLKVALDKTGTLPIELFQGNHEAFMAFLRSKVQKDDDSDDISGYDGNDDSNFSKDNDDDDCSRHSER